MSVHFKILSGILTLLTGKPSFMNMKTQTRSKGGWYAHMDRGVYSLNPDHCRPHRSPAGVVHGGVTASGLRTLKGIQASGLPCQEREHAYP